MKVNGTGFQQCIVSSSNGTLTSGRDIIPLQTPGRKWYICGVGKHCELRNMKLFITVLPQTMAPAPSPVATSASTKLIVPTVYGFVVALFGGILFHLVWNMSSLFYFLQLFIWYLITYLFVYWCIGLRQFIYEMWISFY